MWGYPHVTANATVRRGTIPQHSVWKTDALPIELLADVWKQPVVRLLPQILYYIIPPVSNFSLTRVKRLRVSGEARSHGLFVGNEAFYH